MYTLVDFITHIKGVEYILSVLAIAGFLLLWEALKSKPFRTVVAAGRDDLAYIEQAGYGSVLKSMGRIAAAPMIGLVYLALVPVGFAAALAAAGVELLSKSVSSLHRACGSSTTFEWRPLTAYFSGKGKKIRGKQLNATMCNKPRRIKFPWN